MLYLWKIKYGWPAQKTRELRGESWKDPPMTVRARADRRRDSHGGHSAAGVSCCREMSGGPMRLSTSSTIAWGVIGFIRKQSKSTLPARSASSFWEA